MVDATPMQPVNQFQILGKTLLSVPVRQDTLETDTGQRDVFTILLVKIFAIQKVVGAFWVTVHVIPAGLVRTVIHQERIFIFIEYFSKKTVELI